MTPRRLVVVGGGITGLAAAYRIKSLASRSSRPVEITLLEASDHLGGVLRTTRQDGFLLEAGPDCFISEKPAGVRLCEELGLAQDLIGTNREYQRSFIVWRGKFHPVPEGFYLMAPSRLRPFLASSLLSWRGKWRVLVEPLIPARQNQHDESVASFVRRRLGVEALERLAQPLLAGIYSADPETLSLRATFPQFLEMEEEYNSLLLGLKKSRNGVRRASGARYSLFVTLRDGIQVLTGRLARELPKETVRLGVVVNAIEGGSPWKLHLTNGQVIEADGVCLALPAYRCAELLRPLRQELADQLSSISYTDCATVNVAYRESDVGHPLDGFGYVVPSIEKRTVMACTFVHRKFAGRVPQGHVLLRAFIGGPLQSDLLRLDDRELQNRVHQDLQNLLEIKNPPLFSVVQRWPQAMPQYTVGHIHRVLQIEEMLLGLKGLAVAGNWLRGVGVPDCIDSAELAASLLLER